MDHQDLERYGLSATQGTPPFSSSGDVRPWRNKRTGQVHQVPRGIDPGWDHNVGKIGMARSIIEDVPGAAAMAAAPRDVNDFVLAGRLVREDLVRQAGGKGNLDPDRFRELLRDRLARERGAGEVHARLTGEMAPAVQAEIRGIFPRSWIEKANEVAVDVTRPAPGVRRGGYYPGREGRNPRIEVRKPRSGPYIGHWQGTRVHEYVHHLQRSMPGLNKLFTDLHHRRTKDEQLVQVSGPRHPFETGRKDRYIREYQGREYRDSSPLGPAREVITMAYEYIWQTYVWRPGDGGYLNSRDYPKYRLIRNDPEMLDLAIGALLKYDP